MTDNGPGVGETVAVTSRGPWRAERFFQKHSERIPDHWCWGIEDADGTGYLAILPEDDEALARADAAVIAAAPLLVEALLTIHSTAVCGFTADANLLSIESIARHALREAGVTHIGSKVADG